MSDKNQNISLSYLRQLADLLAKKKAIKHTAALREVATEYGFRSWHHAAKELAMREEPALAKPPLPPVSPQPNKATAERKLRILARRSYEAAMKAVESYVNALRPAEEFRIAMDSYGQDAVTIVGWVKSRPQVNLKIRFTCPGERASEFTTEGFGCSSTIKAADPSDSVCTLTMRLSASAAQDLVQCIKGGQSISLDSTRSPGQSLIVHFLPEALFPKRLPALKVSIVLNGGLSENGAQNEKLGQEHL